MSQYKVLSVRMKSDEYDRVMKAAEREHLKASTWVKQLAFRAVEAQEMAINKGINAPISAENAEKHRNEQQ